MSSIQNSSRYSPILIGLHWFMFVLMVVVFATIEMRSLFPRGSDPRELVKALHFMLGICVLLLVVIRLAVRLSGKTPAIVPAPKPWEKLLATLMHLSLYAFMIFMPIAGWIILSAEGHGVPFFGLELPPLVDKNPALAEQVEDLHKQVGEIGYYLIGLHVLAGLFHHYVKRDNTMTRISLFKPK
ncbi:cytochrome b [Cellvibrio sp. pealriver]|uniref:cytochrome b n=1 Tax=Cellvibrio sp. pealriver TaxID=1622269 RepID=UPI00066FF096|nr:cytochrome b [Cellvibrio sp. pealriver]